MKTNYAHLFRKILLQLFFPLLKIPLKPVYVLPFMCTFCVITVVAQVSTITGTVTSDKEGVLESVTVRVKGTSTVTKTDAKGNFSIKASKGQTLLFSSVSFADYEVVIKDNKAINVNLTSKVEEQDEVIVVGYLQQKRPDVSTAISTVSPKNSEKGAYSNFQQLLGGRAAGVNVMENNSEPGGGINIEVRGVSSISGSTQPLYVIDGVPIEQPNLNLNGSGEISNIFGNNLTANPLAMLNPNDIESIEILKDAAATSLYGTRGANGVVVITTKSGKVGKPKITINFNQSVNRPQKKIEMLKSRDYANYVNESWRLFRERQRLGIIAPTAVPVTADTPFTAKEIENLRDYDHQSIFNASAVTRDASLSISGGAIGGAKYFVSGQYFDQQGVIPGTFLKRYTGRINYDVPLSSKLTLKVNLSVTSTDRFGSPTQTLTSRALNWSPTSPLVNPDGSFNNLWDYRYGSGDATFEDTRFGPIFYNSRFTVAEINTALAQVESSQSRLNPLLITASRGVQNRNTSSQILGTASLNYKFSNSFDVSGKISVNQFNSLLQTFIPINIPLINATYRGEAASGTSQNRSVLYQVNFNYRKKLSPDHTINAALVFSAEKFVQEAQRSVVGNFTNNITGFNNLGAANPQGITSGYTGNQLVGNILQLNYLYKKSIVVNLSARYDGVSKFAEGNQWGLFPATSIAWKLNQENWFKPLRKVMSEAKFRASWGLVGSQAIAPYSTQSSLTPNFSVWGNNIQTIGFSPVRLGNPYLTWETTDNANIGLDLGFFKDRITTTVEVYRRRTKNLLLQVTVPGSSGFTSIPDNIGTLLNEGIELTLGVKIINNRNFKWNIEGNINFNRNLVERFRSNNPNEFYTAGPLGNQIPTLRITSGRPLGAFYGLISQGLWDTTVTAAPISLTRSAREGERRYADLNGDNAVNDLDRTWLGNALPVGFGGINTSISYKNFELSAYFSYAYGNKVFNMFQILWGNPTGLNNIRQDAYNSRYIYVFPGTDPAVAAQIRESNKRATTVVSGTTVDQREVSDHFIEKADFLRCRDISLSYKLPVRMIKRLKVQNVQVYGNIQNPFIITSYSGFNPEVGASSGSGLARGMDNGSAPFLVSYRLGFNVTL